MLYQQVKILGAVLSVPLSAHPSLAPPLERRRAYDPVRYEGDGDMVELSLIALVILALKLQYGYGGNLKQVLTFV